ncbi:hypothetical protein ABNN70_12550 [Sporolactobacillus sp. Y61]|uniref:VOC domain-containing protein n=1 Tax=Sporolactobacillus sp. Y61 TaxID=3160863 RepID=A0AAU8IDD3_9BACL
MLFHYHFWTPYVEKTENFYTSLGFRVTQRIGRYQGEFRNYNPPLSWADFREKGIQFRIIEMKKGAVNLTCGYGKRPKFDHIGFLVTEPEYQGIIGRAREMNFTIHANNRRTFIGIPFGFRIELQRNRDAVETVDSPIRLKQLKLISERDGLQSTLTRLFGEANVPVTVVKGEKTTLASATLGGLRIDNKPDPNGVWLIKYQF